MKLQLSQEYLKKQEGNLAAYTEALADTNEKQGLFGAIIDRIRSSF